MPSKLIFYRRLYIANLPLDSSESEFRKFLNKHGLSENQFLLTMKQGFAFVDFFEQEVAVMALKKLQKTNFNGSDIALEPDFNTECAKSDFYLLFSGFDSKYTTNEDIKNLLGDIRFFSLEPLNSTGENSGAFIVKFQGHLDANQIIQKFSGKTYNEMQIKVENYCPKGENKEIDAEENKEIGTVENEEIGAGDMGNEQPLTFRKKLKSKNSGNSNGKELPLKLMVANDFVGEIIGRKGMTVKNITQKTGARVDILPIKNNSVDKTIQIFGPAENCSAACRKIMKILFKRADFSKSPSNLALRLIVANALIGRVIGKGGLTFNKIMSDTHTKMFVSKMTNMPDFYSENRIITIHGSLDEIMSAEEQVSSKLRAEENTNIMPFKNANNTRHDNRNFRTSPNMNFNNNRRFNGGYNNNNEDLTAGKQFLLNKFGLGEGPNNNNEDLTAGKQFLLNKFGLGEGPNPNDNFNSNNNEQVYEESEVSFFGPLNRQETSYMFIPQGAVGPLIGRNGNNIRKIIDLSGASVNITNAPEMNENCRVTIFGPFESHLRAQELITKQLIYFEKSYKERWESQPIEIEIKLEIMVPSAQVGKLIGKSGEVIRNIQRISRANIRFLTGENEAMASEEGKTVTRLIGTLRGLHLAQLELRRLINN